MEHHAHDETHSLALVRAYGPLLEPIGITYPQYPVMLALWQEDGLSVSSICDQTRLDSGTITPLLKRLEGKNLIQRKRSKTDERVRVISLTDKGQALRNDAEDIPVKLACLDVLIPEQGLQIRTLAETLFQNLRALEVA